MPHLLYFLCMNTIVLFRAASSCNKEDFMMADTQFCHPTNAT